MARTRPLCARPDRCAAHLPDDVDLFAWYYLAVHRRLWVAIGSGATVILAGASGALINELHRGWGWFVAAGAVVLVSAFLTGWLTMRTAGRPSPGDGLAAGAVKAARDIHGPVRTETLLTASADIPPFGGDQLGPGAVKAGRDIWGAVTTRTTTGPDAL